MNIPIELVAGGALLMVTQVIASAGFVYKKLTSIEHRLTRIETVMNLDTSFTRKK